ncbi:MAG: YebC/PmpR family DNA-binding transcriptional regulator [Rhodopirellula sp.]|nr:YebC/PmpR family DNA-binding transcriptional regulator [Rhodopirellula sp.]
MSGHSHWAGIKHKKALVDAKRGKLWSKLSKAIIVAAKMGGGDLDMNIRLRAAVDAAKAVSMPKDNIARAIKKGTGDLEGSIFEEVVYEGYGPCGVAVMCEVLTDNRNRTAPEIRKIFELADGKLGATGCVAWMFGKKGLLIVSADKTDEDSLMEICLDAGADDVRRDGDKFEIVCPPEAHPAVVQALADAKIEPEVNELSLLPNNTVDLDADAARKVLKLMESLDDHDDVQSVSSNFNIPDEVMAALDDE